MGSTVAIVGGGQIGFAVARCFVEEGWEVRLLARTCPAWPLGPVRFEAYRAGEDQAPSADAVVDTVAFDADDVCRYDPDQVGRLVAISSASVYCDERGRTLDEADLNGFPEFPASITESHQTVAPGPDTYSTRKIRMEMSARSCFGDRATILRPCAIHGPWSRHPREWWFVKRVLDGRASIPLANAGQSRFQTTAARAVAETALASIRANAGGVFNVSDDDAPSVREIGQTVCEALGRLPKFVPLDITVEGSIGRTPWSIPRPMMVSSRKSRDLLGTMPLPYAVAVGPAIDWLADIRPKDWRAAFPQLAAYPWDLFDYAAEDRFLSGC